MGIYPWADANRHEDDWARQYAEQTERLTAQLTALRAGPAYRRRRFRALEYLCERCGDVVLEVMKTDPYWTVITWSAEHHPDSEPLSAVSPVEAARERVERGSAIRRGRSVFRPLPAPLPDPATVANRNLWSSCRCQSRHLSESMVMRDLLEGLTKRSLPASSRDD